MTITSQDTANSAVFDFDSLEPAEVKVKYKGKWYLCREASDGAAIKWRDHNLNAAKMEVVEVRADGEVVQRLVGYQDMNENRALIVSECLWLCDDTGSPLVHSDGNLREHVSLEFIKSMPERFARQLFDWIREHSDLGDDTLDGLKRQRAALDRRIAMLEKSQSGSLSKNGLAAGPVATA